jgi:hypothetical protein
MYRVKDAWSERNAALPHGISGKAEPIIEKKKPVPALFSPLPSGGGWGGPYLFVHSHEK